jgi:hypothetical protein
MAKTPKKTNSDAPEVVLPSPAVKPARPRHSVPPHATIATKKAHAKKAAGEPAAFSKRPVGKGYS